MKAFQVSDGARLFRQPVRIPLGVDRAVPQRISEKVLRLLHEKFLRFLDLDDRNVLRMDLLPALFRHDIQRRIQDLLLRHLDLKNLIEIPFYIDCF